MKKSFVAAAAAVSLVGLLAMPASANTTREANCAALGGTFEAGYFPDSHPTQAGAPKPADDTCLITVETGVDLGDWIEVDRSSAAIGDAYTAATRGSTVRVNSGNAKQVVNNVTYTVDTYQQMQDTVTSELDVVTSYAHEALHFQGNDIPNEPSGKYIAGSDWTVTTTETKTEIGPTYTVKVGESVTGVCKENPGSPDRGNACPSFAS
ncbi:MAG: hypothetical protein KG028_11725 [Actinobacteria bacterium]|jgi:hypothetical protein|nr:hypothetical protein [Actinomycetota bacterium]